MTYADAIRRLVERGWVKFPPSTPAGPKPKGRPRGRSAIPKPAALSMLDYETQRKEREERLANEKRRTS